MSRLPQVRLRHVRCLAEARSTGRGVADAGDSEEDGKEKSMSIRLVNLGSPSVEPVDLASPVLTERLLVFFWCFFRYGSCATTAGRRRRCSSTSWRTSAPAAAPTTPARPDDGLKMLKTYDAVACQKGPRVLHINYIVLCCCVLVIRLLNSVH